MDYDVVVVGGSVSGLLAAREVASNGLSALVLEEDAEIGTPEHCGGLVSINGLREILGYIPEHIILNRIHTATISALSTSISIDATRQQVVAVDRRLLDKHIAIQASKEGADITLMRRVTSFKEGDDGVTVNTNMGSVSCKVMIDARGCGALAGKGRGFLPSAQYEVYMNSSDEHDVKVYIDQDRYPGFFAWTIPNGKGIARIGVAGNGINVTQRLEELVGKNTVLRKIHAPIWIGGVQRPFIQGRGIIRVGDAAGQSKPTTAGGIYTSGMGGVIAGRVVSKAILSNDRSMIQEYEHGWLRLFGKEFERMLILRRLFERLDNRAIERILQVMNNYTHITMEGDFDLHSSVLLKIIKSSDLLALTRALLGSEIRRLIR
jgi:digeranylgeranylglycerophospholipid reductase